MSLFISVSELGVKDVVQDELVLQLGVDRLVRLSRSRTPSHSRATRGGCVDERRCRGIRSWSFAVGLGRHVSDTQAPRLRVGVDPVESPNGLLCVLDCHVCLY